MSDDLSCNCIYGRCEEIKRLTRIEEKYTNLCDVLNEQTQEIQVLRNLLQKWIYADDWTIHLTSMAELDEETKAALGADDE